jgi:arylsulfatase A-like enzyme
MKKTLLFLVGCVAVTASVRGETPSPPNLVIVLADDLGYGDVSCNNPERGKIRTPNIDRLAAEGMRFTDAHASSGVCSPSRYTLLTGRYHWRTRLQMGIVRPWEEPLIAPDRLTLGKLAQQHGYRTACIGKWHLGWDWPIAEDNRQYFPTNQPAPEDSKAPTAEPVASDAARAAWRWTFRQPIDGGPTTRGFDEYFGTDIPNWPPFCFIENDRTVGIPSELLPTRLLKDNMASIPGPALSDWRLEEILPTLSDRAVEFIERQAKAKRPFLLYMPLTSPHTPLAVNHQWQGKSGLENRAADFIMETDAVVGHILGALDKNGVAGNTLVVFTSDNGFAPYVGAKELEAKGHFSSGPFRGYKGDAWEGGHRVPFIARWPKTIPPGRVSDELVHQADLMATAAEILGVELPPNAGEDSFSLLPLLRGGDAPIRQYAVSQGSAGLLAIRRGTWKLIVGPDGGGNWSDLSAQPAATTAGQLYQLADDPGEQKNLFAEEPEVVAELLAALKQQVANGRSTAGAEQANDVPVKWRRFLKAPAAIQRAGN